MANQNQHGGGAELPDIPILHGLVTEEESERLAREEANRAERAERDARDERQVAASEAQLKTAKQQHITNIFIAVFTGLLMVISGIGTIISAISANAARDAARAAKEAVDVAHGGLTQSLNAADSSDAQSREAMAASEKQSLSTLNASRDSLRKDQRAWVGPSSPPVIIDSFRNVGANVDAEFTVTVNNSGRSPAFNVNVGAEYIPNTSYDAIKASFDGVCEQFASLIGLKPKFLVSKLPKEFTELPFGQVLFPNMPTPFPQRMTLTDAQAPSGEKRYSIVVCIVYRDQFSTPHWTKFCYTMATGHPVQACIMGNATDDVERR